MRYDARVAGENGGLDAGRVAREKRDGWPYVHGGLLTLFAVVAIAGCGGSDSEDSADTPKSAGTAPSQERESEPGKKLQTLDRQIASGKFATVQAAGSIDKPKAILLSIKATPPQRVQASWSLTCLKGESARTTDGLRDLQTPVSMVLEQPAKDNDSCDVAATVQLAKAGKVIVKLANDTR